MGGRFVPEAHTIAAFRFIHTADLHLDSPLRSLALLDPELADLVGDATRQALVRIVSLCLEEQVDALLIAGDLYDGDQTSMKTARFIGEQFRRLDAAGVRIFLIRGNHDNLARITQALTLPPGATLFGGRAGMETIERGAAAPIAVHGLSFREQHAAESLLPKYRPPAPDAINIGLMHTSLGGAPGHDVYAPVGVGELQASGFRYWALGHIHKRSVVEGPAAVVMPGMPQGRHVNEDGPKSVTLATIGDDGGVMLEERVVGPAEFRRVDVDIGGAQDIADAARRAARTLTDARTASPAAHLIARVRFVGETPLAWRVRRDIDLLREEIGLELGPGRGIWLEAVGTAAREGTVTAGAAAGPTAELARLAASAVLPSEGFQTAARELAEEFVRKGLPNERLLREMLGEDEAESARIVAALAAEGVDEVMARLMAGDAEGPA